jgi:hypothetical protein
MNLSDMYYLKLNLTLLSFNIDNAQKIINKSINNQLLNNEQKEIILDCNFSLEKLNSLISKINITTFTKSNSSIMCQIIYFLIMSYDAPQFSDTLRLCYPVITLNDLTFFKETTYNIISSILPSIILCGKSVLDEASGAKIEKFLRNFSDFVISSKISKQNNKKNIIYEQSLGYKNIRKNLNENSKNNILLNIRKNCLVAQISNLKEIIIEKLNNINNIQNKWKYSALNISKELEKENDKNKKFRNKFNSKINCNKSCFSEISSLDRAPKIESHSQFIKMVEALHQNFIKNEEFKNNINYINYKETKDIIDSLNSKVIINNIKNDINDTQSIISNSNINVSKDKKELENLINELNEKKENFFIKKNAELFVLHELVNILDERIKEDNLKFNKRNINNEKEFRNNTNKLVITLNEQIDKIKILENNLKNLKKDLNIE